MRLLANENFPRLAVDKLRASGHDVAWLREDSPGADDEQALQRAQAEDRILLTFDKDFGALAFRSPPPGEHRRDPLANQHVLPKDCSRVRRDGSRQPLRLVGALLGR